MDLFEPTVLGRVPVRNHFVRSATYEGKAALDGSPTPEIEALYAQLAEGKAGMLITSYTHIAPYEQPRMNQLGMYEDRLVDAFRPLVEHVHECGGAMAMQLVHGSNWGQGHPESALILGPSKNVHPDSGLVSTAATQEHIDRVVELFAKAAGRAKQAGFDAVQLHGAHDYLLSQFMSPLLNHRDDDYGGSLEGRFRLTEQVYRAVRSEVGDGYPVWIKMNSSDELPGGLDTQGFLWMAERLAAQGIDCIEVSGNRWKSHAKEERAYYKDAAGRLVQRLAMAAPDSPARNTDVILTGGLRTLEECLAIERECGVRFFGMARPLLKDPAYIKKLHQGTLA